MIRLESETWYYIYTDGENIFISTDSPIRTKKRPWYHTKWGYKMLYPPLYIRDPKSSGNIVEFTEWKDIKYDNKKTLR